MQLIYVYAITTAESPDKKTVCLYLLEDDLRTVVDRLVVPVKTRKSVWKHIQAFCKRNSVPTMTPTMCPSIGDGVQSIEREMRLDAFLTSQKQQELLQALEDHVNAPKTERSEQDDADLLEIMAESKRRTQREVAELDAYFDEQVRNKFADGSTK